MGHFGAQSQRFSVLAHHFFSDFLQVRVEETHKSDRANFLKKIYALSGVTRTF